MKPAFVIEDSKELLKHTAAVHISNTLSANERKVSNILLKNAFPTLLQQQTFNIAIKKILDHLGWIESKNYANIANILKNLNTAQIEWNIFKKDKKNHWGVTTVLADAAIENGVCSYSYSPKLKELLSQPNIYAKLNLLVQSKLKSKYSLALWEFLIENLCSNNTDKIQSIVNILDIKKLLGVPSTKTYDDFKILNRDVISKAIKEINKVSDIEVKISFIKSNGKKVDAISFISTKKLLDTVNYDIDELAITYHNYVDSSPSKEPNINLINELIYNFDISEKVANDILTKYEQEFIRKTIDFIKNSFSTSKIKNKAAYFLTALENEWASKTSDIKSDIINQKQNNKTLSQKHILSFKNIERTFLEQVYSKYGCDFYKSWMTKCTDIIYDKSSSEFTITVQNNFIKDWLYNNYANNFIVVIHSVLNSGTILVIKI